jgi:hypothetical protein
MIQYAANTTSAPYCRASKSQQTGCSGIINNMQEDVYLAKAKARAGKKKINQKKETQQGIIV